MLSQLIKQNISTRTRHNHDCVVYTSFFKRRQKFHTAPLPVLSCTNDQSLRFSLIADITCLKGLYYCLSHCYYYHHTITYSMVRQYIPALCLKKFPPLNSLQLCQILTGFQTFCTAGKHMKFATKPMQQYPSHFRHVATLPWDFKNQIFCRYSADIAEMQTYCIIIALTLLFTHKF